MARDPDHTPSLDASRHQLPAASSRNPRIGRDGNAEQPARVSLPAHPPGSVLESHRTRSGHIQARRARPAGRCRRTGGQADHPVCRRHKELRLSRVLRPRPPATGSLSGGKPRRSGRASARARGRDRVHQPHRRALSRSPGCRRLASRARSRRSSRDWSIRGGCHSILYAKRSRRSATPTVRDRS